MQSCERVNPYNGDRRRKSQQVREMFDNIAPAYDFMNRAMTFGGIDKLWRRKAIRQVGNGPHRRILDIATGTGDLAIQLARRTDAESITGIDLSEGMLAVGRQKVEKAGLQDRITLTTGDSLQLDFPDATFDAITVAYGVRNFEDLEAGYREMLRVLRPGGTLTVLELSTPKNPLVKPFYKAYTRWIIPAVGRLVSKDIRAYTYLPESIAAVPQREAMTSLISKAGFEAAAYRSMTFGTCCMYIGRKPQ